MRGEERKREERRGEENFIPIDKDLFNPLSLCSIVGHTHGSDKRETRKRGEERRQDGDEKERRTLYQ